MSPTVLPPGMLFAARDILTVDRVFADHIRYLRGRDGVLPRDVLALAENVHPFAAEIRRNLRLHTRTAPRKPRPLTADSEPPPEWVTVRQAAALTGVSVSYVQRLARRGIVQATRAGDGRTWLVDADGLAVWAARRTPDPDDTP
ncbi:helix-turn-helix domain-containing protein [Streptomyces hokutonensis]|uniref:helix-turn-helix domain-containing protein n=1 Tax=Streptomyces hokutonensis TaxID=1306990 RepID=UPI0003A159C5|nr:helix-turn-helix domain-containing protein [Streptomyces hokutonensis]